MAQMGSIPDFSFTKLRTSLNSLKFNYHYSFMQKNPSDLFNPCHLCSIFPYLFSGLGIEFLFLPLVMKQKTNS